MRVLSLVHKKNVLLFCSRSLHKTLSACRAGSQVASYHMTSFLESSSSSSSSIKPVLKRRRRSQHEELQEQGKSFQSKTWKNDTPVLQEPYQKRRDNPQISSELKKLCLDDFPSEKKRQRSTQNLKSEEVEIVFGISPCLLALMHGRRHARKLFVKDGEASNRASLLKVCEEAHGRGVQVQRVSKKDLDRMSSGRVHQGVCLQASSLSYLTDDNIPEYKRKHNTPPLWLILERIQDPMNLGAILRTAYFLGVDRVGSSLQHCCPLSPVVSKASSGVMEVMGVYGYENLEEMLKLKVDQGWQIVGTVGAGEEESMIPVTNCLDFQISKPTLLLMGGEGEGLSRGILSLCQTLLTIPAGRELSSGVESLNVSVAAGILLHSLLKSSKSNRGSRREK